MGLTAFPDSSLGGQCPRKGPARVSAVIHGAGWAEGPSEEAALPRTSTKIIPDFEI